MTCHNRCAKTKASLEAMAEQDLRTDVSLAIYVVDAGSSDGTPQSVRQRFPNVHLIETDASVYWNHGMRIAFAAALAEDFDAYFWLNDDTVLARDALARFLSTASALAAEGHPPGILVGVTADPDTGAPTYGGVLRGRVGALPFRRLDLADHPQRADTMNGNCVLVPRDVAREVGNLDPAFSHAMGDFDYGLRASRAGFPIWTVPGVVGCCARNSDAGTWRDRRLTPRERWRIVQEPRGLPPAEWKVFVRRHGGLMWPLRFATPYLRLILPSRRPARPKVFRRLPKREAPTSRDHG
jgi:GT2 family glycosyltransferase